MASGTGTKGYAVIFAVVVLIVLAATGVFNPSPELWSRVTIGAPIADGSSRWQVALSGSPASVAIADDAVVVAYRTRVESYGLGALRHGVRAVPVSRPERFAHRCGACPRLAAHDRSRRLLVLPAVAHRRRPDRVPPGR